MGRRGRTEEERWRAAGTCALYERARLTYSAFLPQGGRDQNEIKDRFFFCSASRSARLSYEYFDCNTLTYNTRPFISNFACCAGGCGRSDRKQVASLEGKKGGVARSALLTGREKRA